MNRKAALQLSMSFLVIIIICIVVFSFSIYTIRRFFTQAEIIKMTYDERTEKEIERLLDDGSRIAIPFDKKTISNGEFKTFGIGILNMLNIGSSNDFRINISFNKAFDKRNDLICSAPDDTFPCGNPSTWLQTTAGLGDESGVVIEKTIKNNEQEKFLLGINVKGAPSGTYIFDLDVKYYNNTDWLKYDPLHKLYVDVP
jgi:hypothetical protein